MVKVLEIAAVLAAVACSATPQSTTTGASSATLAAGAPCGSNSVCASGLCGSSFRGGIGNCCAAACALDAEFAACGATGCDNAGACSYPSAGTACGEDFCLLGQLTQHSCNGSGTCSPEPSTPCADGFGCADRGTCAAVCGSTADCASGLACNDGSCGPPIALGPCTEDADCTSGVCGMFRRSETDDDAGDGDQRGQCCAGACVTNDGGCGATSCDQSGACVYPIAATACGAACATSSSKNTSRCDGQGTCVASAIDCAPYGCAAGACFTSCSHSSQCAPGQICDPTYGSCCAGPAPGGEMAADSSTGDDSIACCGTGGHQPCQSITRAMQLIDGARAQGVTLRATIGGSDAGGDWSALEIYPLVLGWNVELSAPGVFFHDPFDELEIFDVDAAAFSGGNGSTAGQVSIVGAPGAPVSIGPSAMGEPSRDHSVVRVEPGSTLYLANANLNDDATFQSTAITVAGGATLVVGQDRAAAVTGTVTIGNALGDVATDGWNGIVCETDGDAGAGCTIRDGTIGVSSLVIEGQENFDLFASDLADISLGSAPAFGVPPTGTGFQTCPAKPDGRSSSGAGILLGGRARVALTGASVQCMAGDGIDLVGSNAGSPSLTLTGATLRNIGGAALYASAGRATVRSSSLQFNYFGAWQDGQAQIDLSSDAVEQPNAMICCDMVEATTPQIGAIGICVVNTSSFGTSLDATNAAWDHDGPDLYSCNPDRADPPRDLINCGDFACQSSHCDQAVVDAVYTSTGTILINGHRVATLTCHGH